MHEKYIKNNLRFDLNYYRLIYNDRIGFVSQIFEENGYETVKTEKGNVGNAIIQGFESLVDYNFNNLFTSKDKLNLYINFAYTKSVYAESEENSVKGNEVEFTPKYNTKTGIKYIYQNSTLGLQYSYLSNQFTDASNAKESDITGIIGEIPAYYILDFSYSINFSYINLYFGINNLTNNYYFTRRATGYPGPGIIPSPGRNYYLTCEVNL